MPQFESRHHAVLDCRERLDRKRIVERLGASQTRSAGRSPVGPTVVGRAIRVVSRSVFCLAVRERCRHDRGVATSRYDAGLNSVMQRGIRTIHRTRTEKAVQSLDAFERDESLEGDVQLHAGDRPKRGRVQGLGWSERASSGNAAPAKCE